MSDYNGWSNYPTWCVHLWLTNEEPLYDEARDIVSRADGRYAIGNALKSWVRDELAPDLEASFAADLLGYALDQVDWFEIADAFIEENA